MVVISLSMVTNHKQTCIIHYNIRISLTTRENTFAVRDGEGFMEVTKLLHVLMFWELLARPAGRSDWPAKNYPVRTSRVMSVVVVAQQRTLVARMQTCIFLRNVFLFLTTRYSISSKNWIIFKNLNKWLKRVRHKHTLHYIFYCTRKNMLLSLLLHTFISDSISYINDLTIHV